MLFFLLAGHALMDFGLQSEAIAICKCRTAGNPLQKQVPWYYWLSAHALLHGAAVAGVILWFGGGRFDMNTAVMYGVLETVIHWFIDLGKCEGLYSVHADQGLHVTCKFVWYGMLLTGVVWPA